MCELWRHIPQQAALVWQRWPRENGSGADQGQTRLARGHSRHFTAE